MLVEKELSGTSTSATGTPSASWVSQRSEQPHTVIVQTYRHGIGVVGGATLEAIFHFKLEALVAHVAQADDAVDNRQRHGDHIHWFSCYFCGSLQHVQLCGVFMVAMAATHRWGGGC